MISKEERAKLYNTVFKADNEFDDVSLDMMLEEYHDLHENIHEEYVVKARVKETLFDVLAILGLDDDYSDWCFEEGGWKQ